MNKELKTFFEGLCGINEDCIKTIESFRCLAMRYASQGKEECVDKVHYHVHGVILGLSFCGVIPLSSVDFLTDWIMNDSLLELKIYKLREGC